MKRRIGKVARWNLVALSVLLAAGGCVRAEGGPRPETGVQETKEIVVLLHGLGRSKSAMRRLASRLERAGYAVERIGYRSLVRLDGFCQPGLVLRSGSDDKVNRLAPGKLLLLKPWVF